MNSFNGFNLAAEVLEFFCFFCAESIFQIGKFEIFRADLISRTTNFTLFREDLFSLITSKSAKSARISPRKIHPLKVSLILIDKHSTSVALGIAKIFHIPFDIFQITCEGALSIYSCQLHGRRQWFKSGWAYLSQMIIMPQKYIKWPREII